MRRTHGWFLATAAILCGAASVRAEVIELVGGRAIQGKVLGGQCSEEDGLAVELFDTGGVIMVRWDHIVPARAQELKEQTGVAVPEEDEILVAGHRVLRTDNTVVEGRALNPDQKDQPLQLKTRSSVQPIDRSQIARIDEAQLDGLLVYTPDELYQVIRDQNPPETPAAHRDISVICMKIGALAQAKTHLDAAMADRAFGETASGKALPGLQRQLETLIRSKGAQDLVAQIRGFMRSNRYNEALAQLNALDAQYKDESIRRLIRFELLENQVVRGRDIFFRKEVQKKAYSTMNKLIETKSREKKPLRADEGGRPGVATPGTLASARQWLTRDLPTQLWEKVEADLGIKPEERERFWKERSGTNTTSASYGTGSFIVIKRAAGPKGNAPGGSARRPAGSTRDSGQGPQRQTKEDKPKTEEEWWEERSATDKALWMRAYFVESSGIFEIRIDESELCDNCGGRGINVANNSDGTQSQTICPKCNGATKTKKVHYR